MLKYIWVYFMKKYYILESIVAILILIGFVVFLVLNQNKDLQLLFNYRTSLITFGFILPISHIIFIVIKMSMNKTYVSNKYDSMMTYFIVLFLATVLVFLNYVIKDEWFYKLCGLFWIFIPFAYVLFITLGILLSLKDKKKINKLKNIRINKTN